MKLGYVCTNYNNSAVTIEAMDSLRATPGHDYFCVVVDNASRPDEQAKIAAYCAQYDNCDVVQSIENLGYFNGLNLGLDHIRTQYPDVEWMLIGNNDLEFGAGFADRLNALRPTYVEYCVISPDIVTLDGDHQNPHVVVGISPLREIMYDLYYSNFHLGGAILKMVSWLPRESTERGDEANWKTAQEIYQGHGSCYILTPKFFRTLKRFWAPTFLYYEEYFLSHQLAQIGEKVLYHPGLVVRHKCHASFSKLPRRKVWDYSRDAHRIYRKYVSRHGPRHTPPPMQPYTAPKI